MAYAENDGKRVREALGDRDDVRDLFMRESVRRHVPRLLPRCHPIDAFVDVDRYLAAQPPPVGLEARWYGLTYINMVWQDRMVTGMLRAFLGSFLIVFLMMLVMLRSGLWALLSMIPLTMTIGAIYGVIGLIGKDYDMPVAVLSSLSLGLAIDFAIHFLVRARALTTERGSWQAAAGPVFGAPARAITRNGLVVSLGFLPLLLAPLVPYQTVGALIAAILIASGARPSGSTPGARTASSSSTHTRSTNP